MQAGAEKVAVRESPQGPPAIDDAHPAPKRWQERPCCKEAVLAAVPRISVFEAPVRLCPNPGLVATPRFPAHSEGSLRERRTQSACSVGLRRKLRVQGLDWLEDPDLMVDPC